MNLPDSITQEIERIFSSHMSNEVKKYSIERFANINDVIATEIMEHWTLLTAPPEKKPIWKHPKLQLDKKGAIMTSHTTNLFVILKEHPKFAGRLSYNEFSFQYCYDGKEIQDMDYNKVRVDLCNELNLNFKKADVIDIADQVAKNNPFHPIRDYLKSLNWDGVDRMTKFANAMQVETTELNISVLTKWLIASVKRVMEPGCKVDSIPVFQGLTGNRKSSALKALMHDESWFTDEPVDFGTKDSKQILLGKWFVELAELSSFNKKDNNLIKSNITQTVDEFRSPYDRKARKYPRQFVYIGTTNDLEFMTDPTSNRRFWVMVNMGLIDIDGITMMRNQLWAQAYSMYKSGEKSYLEKDQEAEMSVFVSKFEVKDAWHDEVIKYISENKKTFVTTSEILNFIKPNTGSQTGGDRKRVTNILQFMKWHTKNARVEGTVVAGWANSNREVKVHVLETPAFVTSSEEDMSI